MHGLDVVESMGSELYAHFSIEGHGGVQSKDLEELGDRFEATTDASRLSGCAAILISR